MVGFWIVLGKGFGFWGNGRRTMGYFGVFVLWENEGKGVSIISFNLPFSILMFCSSSYAKTNNKSPSFEVNMKGLDS